jgi:hypothetical protein
VAALGCELGHHGRSEPLGKLEAHDRHGQLLRPCHAFPYGFYRFYGKS